MNDISGPRRMRRRTAAIAAIAAVVVGFTADGLAQGSGSAGHPTMNGVGVFAAWNASAGYGLSGGYAAEDHPNLAGWDYRINVPYVRFNPTNPRMRSGAAMVGVIEDTVNGAATLQNALHVNNAIWLFAVDVDGVLRFKVLPSRRSATSASVENVGSLAAEWNVVGPVGQRFQVEKPSAVVLGAGIGTTVIHVVARAADKRLLLTSRLVDATSVTTWTTPWIEVAPRADNPATASTAFGDRVAIAWPVGFPSRIETRIYTPASATFGTMQTVTNAGALPQLVWDGSVVNLFYIGPILQQHAWHAIARNAAPFTFESASRIGDTTLNTHCDAIAFNLRLHVACARLFGGRSTVWYSTSTTPFGMASAWEPASSVGLDDHSEPQVGVVGSELYVLASSSQGVVQYSRKDPHTLPYEWTGGSQPREQWLERGSTVDQIQAQMGSGLWGAELLSFNHDLYLTAAERSNRPTAGLYLVNFSRAALKRLIQQHLGIRLVWGRDYDDELFAAGRDLIASPGGTFLLADVNGDGKADLVHAVEAPGGGDVRVALSTGTAFEASSVLLPGFVRAGDVIRAGDVDGDGFADIVRAFTLGNRWNVTVAYSAGTGIRSQITYRRDLAVGDSTLLVGDVNSDGRDDLVVVRFGATASPVDVVLAGSQTLSRPSQWSTAAARTGDVVVLADVNGDRKKDLVIISRTPPPGGGVPGIAVAFSTGTRFSQRMRWASTPTNLCRSYGVGDFNQDGRDDLVCFTRDLASGGPDRRTVSVLFSEAVRFSQPTMLVTKFAGERDEPLIGNVTGDTKGQYTNVPADASRPILDLVRADLDTGRIGWLPALSLFPVPSGVPWERYRFFTEKGLGVAMFPDRLWMPHRCVKPGHWFVLLGAAGSADGRVTRLSVRPGSTQGHVLEELGHSVFANCIPGAEDPLSLVYPIYSKPMSAGGFEADNMTDSCNSDGSLKPGAATWVDCRDPQHYFLAFMRTYRTAGNLIRSSIAAETDAPRKAAYRARYAWLKEHWFNGVEFYRDPTAIEARRETHGLQCLPGVCDFRVRPPEPPGGVLESLKLR